jgi:hypothetical protein
MDFFARARSLTGGLEAFLLCLVETYLSIGFGEFEIGHQKLY